MTATVDTTGVKKAEQEQERARNLDQDIRATVRTVQGGTSHLFELIASRGVGYAGSRASWSRSAPPPRLT